jgi:hypothetical protein
MADLNCAQCQRLIHDDEPREVVESGTLCMNCYDQLRRVVEDHLGQFTRDVNYPVGFAANLAGALVGAAIYAASVAFSGVDFALVALAIPWIGVFLMDKAIGVKRTRALQLMTVGISTVMFGFSRVLTAWIFINQNAEAWGIDPVPLADLPFVAIPLLIEIAGPLDLLWLGIIVYSAWRRVQPIQVR